MGCSCSGACSCDASIPIGPRGFPGEPGPANTLTVSADELPAGSSPTAIITGVSPNQHLTLGIPNGESPVFDTNVPVTTLASGSPATASIDNTDPLTPILSLGIPEGADGDDGINAFTGLASSFVQPAAGSTVTITVGNTSWMSLDAWIHIAGGGHYVVASNPLSATQIIVRNPGAADLSPFGWVATSIPTNTAPGATIADSGFDTQVQASGPPGTIGEQGTNGLSPEIVTVYSVPVSPPLTAADRFVFYANAAPPARATQYIPYAWDGASWIAGPNVAGAPGSQTFFRTNDPNLSPPVPSTVGDVYWRTSGSTLTAYQQTGPTTWAVEATLSMMGTATTAATHTSPGTITLDAAVFSHLINANKDIDLAFDATNYDGQGTWTVVIWNSDGSPIDLTAGTLLSSGTPTFPLSIPAGDSAIVVVRKSAAGPSLPLTRFVIEQAYVPA